jgi:hydroxymethylpyrimidine pyrophosphatase-like HAD family hydrolase
MLAGADRIEGTLFGNGERTGNVDIVNLAMNMYAQGVDPELDFSNMPELAEMFERLTQMKIDDRHPYCGKLVYIAENGALCEYKGEVIAKTPMDRKLALEIIEDVYEQPDCEVLISGQHTAYIKPKTEEYHYRMTKVVNYKTTLIDKFTDAIKSRMHETTYLNPGLTIHFEDKRSGSEEKIT